MIAIEVELLTGRYIATRFDDRGKPEWPPHPSRLFSALVATATDDEEATPASRRALEWLEQQGAPRILASVAESRSVFASYVPENTPRVLGSWSKQEEKLDAAMAALAEAEARGDETVRRLQTAADKARAKLDEQIASASRDDGEHHPSACSKACEMLPAHRGKQPRMLPSVTPHAPRVRYVWSDAAPDVAVTTALAELARGVVRLGHSSSLVACRVVGETTNDDALAAWIPSDSGDEMLRTVEPGQLSRLERAFTRHRGFEPRVLPARHQRYRPPEEARTRTPERSVFGEWLVLREIAPHRGRRLGIQLSRTEDITRALRGALLHHADDPLPAVLSGHTPDGRPLERPHVAYLALADVAARRSRETGATLDVASGAVLGAALVLPRDIDSSERRAVLRALGHWQNAGMQLRMGRAGAMHLEHIIDRDPRTTLDPAKWTRPARRWASVTPVALDENPGDLHSRDPAVAARAAERAEELIARSCERIALPRPAWVQVMRRSLYTAAPAANRFMPFPQKGSGFKRVCVHAELHFDNPVAGPVLLGAGRYFGLGMCRPRSRE